LIGAKPVPEGEQNNRFVAVFTQIKRAVRAFKAQDALFHGGKT
jgi:hypothetical protein